MALNDSVARWLELRKVYTEIQSSTGEKGFEIRVDAAWLTRRQTNSSK